MVVTPTSGNPYPTSVSDCPSGSSFTGGGGYVPPMCYCSNYVAPTPTPAATPAPTPAPTPVGTPPPTCTGSVYGVPATSGTEPASQADCPGGTTIVYGQFVGDPMWGGAWIPGYCACSNYVAPTPAPTPTPTPAPTCAGAQAAYESTYGHDGQCADVGDTPISANPVTCSVSGGHTYVYDSCMSGGYYIGVDGGPAYYNYPYYGF
jgi:hypothetical protein